MTSFRIRTLALTAALAFTGCPCEDRGGDSTYRLPRETVRSIVLTVAEGVRSLDLACASTARAKKDAQLALKCAEYYDSARLALTAAESGVDAWDKGTAGDLPCAIVKAVSATHQMVFLVQQAGYKAPPAAEDALKLAPQLTGGCRE